MKRKMLYQIMVRVFALAVLAGCKPTTPTVTLTINEMECSLDGPMAVRRGDFMIKLLINEKTITDTGYALGSVTPGITLQDLKDWAGADQPPWFFLYDGVHEKAGGNHTFSYDLSKFHGEALYIFCMRYDPDAGQLRKLGAFGPIEVKK